MHALSIIHQACRKRIFNNIMTVTTHTQLQTEMLTDDKHSKATMDAILLPRYRDCDALNMLK